LQRVGKPCKDTSFNRTSRTTPGIGGRFTLGNCALAMSKARKCRACAAGLRAASVAHHQKTGRMLRDMGGRTRRPGRLDPQRQLYGKLGAVAVSLRLAGRRPSTDKRTLVRLPPIAAQS